LTKPSAALAADLQRLAAVAEPLHDAIARAYVRGLYVQAAMFGDLIAGHPTREIRDYLVMGGFEPAVRR